MKQSERPSYKRWYAANRERLLAEARERSKRNPEQRRAYQREWERNNKERLAPLKRAAAKRAYAKYAETRRLKAREARAALRREFIVEYGGRCACCAEPEPLFLTLEHKQRDGKQHRLATGNTSHGVLLDLKQKGWPKEDYELLCFNCNRASWLQGVCPHRTAQKVAA
jgi:hypothetical protein